MAATASKWLRELGGRRNGSGRNLELLLRRAIPLAPNSHRNSNSHQCDRHHFAAKRGGPSTSDQISSPTVAPAFGATSSSLHHHRFLGGNLLYFDGAPGMGKISRVGWDPALGRSVAAFSRVAPPPPSKTSTSVGESSKVAPVRFCSRYFPNAV